MTPRAPQETVKPYAYHNAEEAERLRDELDAAEAERWTAEGFTHQRDPVTAKERRDFWALDIGTSGAFMVRKADGAVFGIKGYGTPDYRKGIGFAHELNGRELLSYRFKRGPFRVDMREAHEKASAAK